MKKRILEYEWIRILAIFSVVWGHSAYLTEGYTKYSVPASVSALYYSDPAVFHRWLIEFIYSFHMPLFFVLSGAVFCLSNFSADSAFRLLAKKFHRLFLPYILWGCLFMIPIKYMFNWYSPDQNFFDIVIRYLVAGANSGHLWFLASLFATFAIVIGSLKLLRISLPPPPSEMKFTFFYSFPFFFVV